MLTDWTHWLSCLHPEQILSLLLGLLLLDGPRYALSRIVLVGVDFVRDGCRRLTGRTEPRDYSCCPSVCVLLPGYNEAETIGHTLRGLWGTYPRMSIIVVDDGSTDGMFQVAYEFAQTHSGVMVLRRPERGGKSSAMNFALQYTKADVIVVIDADSTIEANSIWEIVQPLADPSVGAVSGSVLARNPFANLCTWFQAYEYLCNILVGRIFAARMGILGIVSGAFGAFRRDAVDRVMGWDVGPPEDLDLTLAIRKAGYRVVHAPYAQCYTDLPPTWKGLFKQRRRWDQSGVIRNHCRKHIDMAYFWSRNFRLADFFLVFEAWVFNVFCLYGFVAYSIWMALTYRGEFVQVCFVLYLCYVCFEFVQALSVLYYTRDLGRDALLCAIFPLAPFYQLFLMAARLHGQTAELLFRKSFDDNYVPQRVREATWHW